MAWVLPNSFFLNGVRPLLCGKRAFIVIFIGLERSVAVVLRDARDFVLHDTQGEFGMSLRRIEECFDASRVLLVLISCSRPLHKGVFVLRLCPGQRTEDPMLRLRCACGATVCSRVL